MKSTASCIEFLKTQTDAVILFYSGGKDSLILLDLLTKHFKVHLAFMYFVDGLEHVEKYLHFAQKKYGVEFRKYPHWELSQYINDNYYRFHGAEVPKFKLGDIETKARQDFGCDWIITGMKKADSLNRRLMMGTLFMNAIDLKARRAHPLAEWKKQDCINYIKLHKLPTPVAYNKKNSSGVTISEDVLRWCKKNAPRDYKRLIDAFPFAETLILDDDGDQ